MRAIIISLALSLVSLPALAQPLAEKLHAAVAAKAPIYGVSIGKRDDKSTWVIHFKPEATEQQRTDAQEALEAVQVED